MISLDVICGNCPHQVRYQTGEVCLRDRRLIAEHVTANECPAGRFGSPNQVKSTPCACPCANCGSVEHKTAACPIPVDYDGDYRKDSGGSDGCNCA